VLYSYLSIQPRMTFLIETESRKSCICSYANFSLPRELIGTIACWRECHFCGKHTTMWLHVKRSKASNSMHQANAKVWINIRIGSYSSAKGQKLILWSFSLVLSTLCFTVVPPVTGVARFSNASYGMLRGLLTRHRFWIFVLPHDVRSTSACDKKTSS
jgi:hypothetical protein